MNAVHARAHTHTHTHTLTYTLTLIDNTNFNLNVRYLSTKRLTTNYKNVDTSTVQNTHTHVTRTHAL